MSWFWGKSASTDTKEDAYSKLDPALRDFLDKESPRRWEDTKPQSQRPRPSDEAYRSQLGLNQPGLNHENQNARPQTRPEVPSESLYQDGRYAHLWKSYRPQAELEAAGRSDQDRLAEVIEAYNDRKAQIGRAAMENCVMEQMAEKDCFSNGGWAKRMGMCREENRAFNRCYTMQSRFLKALGYGSLEGRAQGEEERVQMHADKLYHEMLERERVVREAKEEGTEAPAFKSLIQADTTMEALGKDSAFSLAQQRAASSKRDFDDLSSYSLEKQAEIKERTRGMGEEERKVEMQLVAAESRAQLEYAEKLQQKMEEERRHRQERRERGKESMGDTVKRLWGRG